MPFTLKISASMEASNEPIFIALMHLTLALKKQEVYIMFVVFFFEG